MVNSEGGRWNTRRAHNANCTACEEAYARYVELLGKKPSEVKAYWVEGGMKFRYSDDEVTPELAKELDEAKRDIEAGRLIPYEQVRKELGL